MPRGGQRRLRLGELRVHDHRPAYPEPCLGQQRERLRRTGGEQHLVGGPAVPRGKRRARRGGIRVGREILQRRGDRAGEPVGQRVGADVDREVDQARGEFGVAVEPEFVHARDDAI